MKYSKPIFVNNLLDDFGLSPHEFRVLGHVSRRGNCYDSLANGAEICKMSTRKYQLSLKVLVEKKLLIKDVKKKGRAVHYTVNPYWESIIRPSE